MPFFLLALLSGVLGLVLVSPIGQLIYVVGLISVIGIPLAMLVSAIPAVALAIVAGYLIWRFVPAFRKRHPLVSIAAAGMLLVLVPPAHNAEIRMQVARLTGGDVGPRSGPEGLSLRADQSLALVSKQGRAQLCDPICLHLLMSGQAARVLMVPMDDDDTLPDPAMRAVAYTFERRAECPAPEVRFAGANTNSQDFKEKAQGTISGRYATMLDLGHCLVAAEATLGEADLAFLYLDRRRLPVPMTLSPVAADIRASRASVLAPAAQGDLAPVWQQTWVSYSLLGPVLMPKINVSAGLSGTNTTWWRERVDTERPAVGSLAELVRATGIQLPAPAR